MRLKAIILLFPSLLNAAEADYRDKWCNGIGQIEVRLQDGTRADCVTDRHAIEVDYSEKWYQSIAQSLHYAMHTGKRAGILLIVREDRKYFKRCKAVIDHYGLPIDLWSVER